MRRTEERTSQPAKENQRNQRIQRFESCRAGKGNCFLAPAATRRDFKALPAGQVPQQRKPLGRLHTPDVHTTARGHLLRWEGQAHWSLDMCVLRLGRGHRSPNTLGEALHPQPGTLPRGPADAGAVSRWQWEKLRNREANLWQG